MTFDDLTRGLRPYLILTLLCLALFAPGLAGLPPLDRDESRFAQATRQMLESGDYIRIRFQDELRAKKPPGTYWLQAAAVRALSHPLSTRIWPYRLPGALAAWAAVLMTYAFGRGLLGAKPALLGAMALAASAILVAEAHQAKTDAILLACVVAAQGALGRIYVAAQAGRAGLGAGRGQGVGQGAIPVPDLAETLTFWLAQGLGILVKGPILPAISLLTVAALCIADREVRWLLRLRPITGTIIAAAVAAPWFVAVSHATGDAFVGTAIKTDLLPKLLGAQEAHGGFPGLFTLLAVALLWPGSLVAWPAMVSAWGERKRLAYRFLLAWALPCWLMFELVPTKLPHYVLPAFPAIFLIAGARVAENASLFTRSWTRIYAVAWGLLGIGVAAAAILLPRQFGAGFDPVTLPIAAGILLATGLAVTLALQSRPAAALAAGILLAGATWPPALAAIGPRLDKLWVSREVAQIVESLAVKGPVASAGYSEPSLVFLLGTETVLTNGAGAADHLAAHPGSVVIVGTPERAAFDQKAQALSLGTEPMGEVRGLDYSRGKPADLTVFGVKAP